MVDLQVEVNRDKLWRCLSTDPVHYADPLILTAIALYKLVGLPQRLPACPGQAAVPFFREVRHLGGLPDERVRLVPFPLPLLPTPLELH